jgi:hypothetical protein
MAFERSDAFIIKIFDNKVRVISPGKFDKDLSVIVENKTQVKIIAKLQGESGTNYSYFSIAEKKSQSQRLKDFKKEKIYFVPLSPPLQKVILKLGSKPYEIPSEK